MELEKWLDSLSDALGGVGLESVSLMLHKVPPEHRVEQACLARDARAVLLLHRGRADERHGAHVHDELLRRRAGEGVPLPAGNARLRRCAPAQAVPASNTLMAFHQMEL